MRWRLKRLVLGVERVRVVIKEWPWDAIAAVFAIELVGIVVALLVTLALLAIRYGNPDKAPGNVSNYTLGGVIVLSHVIGWWWYLHVWARIVRWAKTAERVVTQLNQRG